MSKVLKLLTTNVIYNDQLGMILLNFGRTTIPAKRNSLGIYVEDSSYRRTELRKLDISFLPGRYLNISGEYKFTRGLTEEFRQLFMPQARDLGIKIHAYRNNAELALGMQLSSICELVNMNDFFTSRRLFVHPVEIKNSGNYYLEVYYAEAGLCSLVYLVHRTLGNIFLSVEYDKHTDCYMVVFKQKFFDVE